VKFLPLIFANLGRKKVRTALTVGSFAVALFLFGLLAALRDAFSMGAEVAGADRLMVVNKVSLIQPLRLTHADRIRRIPGVTVVSSFAWFGGVYQDEKNFFAQFAIDPENHRALYPEFVVPPEQWQAFLDDKAGAVAGKALAERFGWKVGDRIPIRGTAFEGNWEFNLHGIYTGTRPQDDLTQFWFRRDYLEDRAPQWWRGLVGWYGVKIANPEDAVSITRAIDEAFANSAWETRTQTEKAMAASFAKQMGNIEFLILAIGGVVFFTLLLVAGSTMATVVRERTSELAVLKALGYSDGFVLVLVLAESACVAGVGGALGLGLVKLFTMGGDPTGGMLPYFFVSGGALSAGLAAALGVGLVAGLLPALSAQRLRVVDALRRL
jgi:putative ABC transport system permease protein